MLTIEIDPSIIDHEVLGPVFRKGMLQGLEEGKQQGLEQGVEAGQRALLRRQIERKFGSMPAKYESRLTSLSLGEIEAASERILDAQSLEEVFSPQYD